MRSWRRTRYVAVAALAAALILPATALGRPPTFGPPKRFYLALGDSIAFGYQDSKARQGLPPSGYNTGYVDDLAARLRAMRPGISVVNYGCSGETTSTFIAGGCPAAAPELLHDPFSGPQLQAAVAFLRAHRGQVSPITLTLWSNDVREFVVGCGSDFGCIARGFQDWLDRTSANYDALLASLRDAAPDAEIIITGPWDQFIGNFAFADPLFQRLDATLAAVAADHGARFAELLPTFNPQGDAAAETHAICTLTLLCTDDDSHPSDYGYQVIADAVLAVSGYDRLDIRPGS